MRIMALDVGSKTIGVAVSDLLGITAQGVEVIRRNGYTSDLNRLSQLIEEFEVDTVVIGLPKHMNGDMSEQGLLSMEMGNKLLALFPKMIVEYWDERLSSLGAERYLIEGDVSRKKRKQVIDKMAAMFILQGYLDRRSCKG